MLRFHLPLVKPDVQFSRIRLPDRDSRVRPRKVTTPPAKLNQAQHIVLAGASGSGKSRFIRHLVRQWLRLGKTVFVLDTQNEFTDLAREFEPDEPPD